MDSECNWPVTKVGSDWRHWLEPNNVRDHRVRTIDLPFQNHAQAGLARVFEMDDRLFRLGDHGRYPPQMKPPTEKDWNIAENGIDLDIGSAYRTFNGKTHEQAVAMFEEASEIYQEDVMWMPLACFRFYVRPYLEYLNSDGSAGDCDGSNCFFSLVEFRLNEILALDRELLSLIHI